MKLNGKEIFHLFKGSLKDPFLYLGITSLILFGILSSSGSILKSLNNQRDFSFLTKAKVSKILPETLSPDLFLGPTKKFSPESPDFLLIEKISLAAASPPVMITSQALGIWLGESGIEDRREISEYLVEEGDSLWSIASKFKISLDTLLWVNDLNKNSIIKPGQKLIILPVSGVVHHVKIGDTISEIAKKYKAQTEEIITFNNLSQEGDIFVGDILIVPDGLMPLPSRYFVSQIPLASTYFFQPTQGRISQGLHWYNAVDIANSCGTPISAAAQGQVLKTRYGYNRGAGNYLTILHPNGVVTMYGHLANILVNPGEPVSQGQIIALMGGQPGIPGAGSSTGCHLHFGVIGARNPFAK